MTQSVNIPVENALLRGDQMTPPHAKGLVVFSHGSGSSRKSPRNKLVAEELNKNGFASLLLDLLTEEEDMVYDNRFDIDLLSKRLEQVSNWVKQNITIKELPLGYFGASTGAASALCAAAILGNTVKAVVSRGGRPDLAMEKLPEVKAPVLLIVGGHDEEVIELNQAAYTELTCEKHLQIVPGATHLFEEPGTLNIVADLACQWYTRYLK